MGYLLIKYKQLTIAFNLEINPKQNVESSFHINALRSPIENGTFISKYDPTILNENFEQTIEQ